MRTISEDEYLEVHNSISADPNIGDYTAPTRRTVEFIDQLVAHTAVTRCFEVGFGAGHFALLLLQASASIHLTSIDDGSNEYTQPAMDLIHSKFLNRFVGKIADSTTYSMEDDPEKDNYELAILDGDRSSVQAVHQDLELIDRSAADWILITQVLDPNVENAVDAFLTEKSEDWTWNETVQWEMCPPGTQDNNVYVQTAFLLNRLRSLDD
jgi:predicted O-methyltransferase YrrM